MTSVNWNGCSMRSSLSVPRAGSTCAPTVVEVTHSWFNRFRKLLVRYEKFTETYEALLHMAAAMIAFRKAGVIYG